MPTSTLAPRALAARAVVARAVAALAAAGVAACSPSPRADAATETAAAGGDVVPAESRAAAAPRQCPEDNGGLVLPAGFCATVFADSIGAARHLVVAPNGDVFVNAQSGRRGSGGTPGLVALRDTNRDGRADRIERIGERGGTGIALHGGFLYQDVGEAIVRWPIRAGELRPSGAAETVLSGLPTDGHGAHSIVVGPDGALYVNVGSRSNSCQQRDRQASSPGHDACTELETRAGIWRYDAGRTGQRFSPAERFATGIRNAVGMTLAPDGALWATQHGRDQLHQNWGELFTAEESAEKPAEELLRVTRGADFGWPYCYWDRELGRRVLAPEYGGDGEEVGRCAEKAQPVAAFPGHWAPNGLLFYTGEMLPARYRGGAFIAFHGSWNRAPLPQAGFRVVFQPLANGRAAGDFETIARHAEDVETTDPTRRVQRLRPTGLAQGPDGALYITDDSRGRVWRVTYGGE
jgi:glucose/arabinose dehydrogenase